MQNKDILQGSRALLATTADRWHELVAKTPPELLTRPAALGEWSALNCLRHLLDAEQKVFPPRVRAFLEGRDFGAFDPTAEAEDRSSQSPEELARSFTANRAESLALLERLSPADLALTATHAELGQVTLGQLLSEWAAHDLMHTVQAEQALMQPFIAACGPWEVYFTAHDKRDGAAGTPSA